MLRVGRNQNVSPDVDAGPGTLLERDDGKSIEEVVQHLLTFRSRLRGDAVAYLGGRIKNVAVISDLSESAQAADGGGGSECLKVAVIHFGGEAGGSDLVQTNVFVKVQRETIGANGAMERDEHFSLLGITDTLDSADQSRALRHQKLLVIVGVIIRGQHDENRAAETAVDMVGHNTLKDGSLKDAVEAALILIEAVRGHRIGVVAGLRLL